MMRAFIALFFFLLSSMMAFSQEVINRFVVPNVGQGLVILNDGGKLFIDLSGKKQLLMTFDNSLESTKVQDTNKDGFQDVVFGFKWREGHLFNHIFLYNSDTELFEEFTLPAQKLLDLETTENGKFRIYHFDDGWDEYTFASPGKVYKSVEERIFNHSEIGLEFIMHKEYDKDGKLTTAYFSNSGEEKEEMYHYVKVDKLELYEEPVFGSKSKGYLVSDDEFRILDSKDNEWLKIAYTNKKSGKITAWVNAAEMLIDKYKLDYTEKPEEGNVNLGFWYPYYDDGKIFGLGLGVSNNSAAIYSYSNNARIYILLENAQGRRYLYGLYEVPAAIIQPKTLKETYGKDKDGIWHIPSELLDDNNVEWDEERQQYVIFRDIGKGVHYPRFIPTDIPDGAYKMYLVLYDPYNGLPPLLSNPQDITFPLPKVPLKMTDDNVNYD